MPSWISALLSTVAPGLSSVGHLVLTHWRTAAVSLLILSNVLIGLECKHLLAERHTAAVRAATAAHENAQLTKARDSLAAITKKSEAEHARADSVLHQAETKVSTRIVYVRDTTQTATPDSGPPRYLPVNLADIPEVHDLIKSANDEKAAADAQIIVLQHQLAVDDTIIKNDSTVIAAIPAPKESTAAKIGHVFTNAVSGAAGAAIGGAVAGPIGIAVGAVGGTVIGLVAGIIRL